MVIEPIRNPKENLVDQVQRRLLDLIRSGAYKRGEKLPTEVDLAAQLKIARGTLREALNELELRGVIERKHGLGTFIAKKRDIRLQSELEKYESVIELADRAGIQIQFIDLIVQEMPAAQEIARILQLEPGTVVTYVERIILADGNRVAYMRDITPSNVLCAADIDDTFRGSVLDLIRRKRELQISKATAQIEAMNADPNMAKKMGIELGLALLVLEEVLFAENEQPVEYSYNCFVPNFFQFNVSRLFLVR